MKAIHDKTIANIIMHNLNRKAQTLGVIFIFDLQTQKTSNTTENPFKLLPSQPLPPTKQSLI